MLWVNKEITGVLGDNSIVHSLSCAMELTDELISAGWPLDLLTFLPLFAFLRLSNLLPSLLGFYDMRPSSVAGSTQIGQAQSSVLGVLFSLFLDVHPIVMRGAQCRADG